MPASRTAAVLPVTSIASSSGSAATSSGWLAIQSRTQTWASSSWLASAPRTSTVESGRVLDEVEDEALRDRVPAAEDGRDQLVGQGVDVGAVRAQRPGRELEDRRRAAVADEPPQRLGRAVPQGGVALLALGGRRLAGAVGAVAAPHRAGVVAEAVARAPAVDDLVERVVAGEAVVVAALLAAALRLGIVVGVGEQDRRRHQHVVRRAGAREAAQHARDAAAEVVARPRSERADAGVRIDPARAEGEELAVAAELGEPEQRADDRGLAVREPRDARDREDRGADRAGGALAGAGASSVLPGAALGRTIQEVERDGGESRLHRIGREQLLGGPREAGRIAPVERRGQRRRQQRAGEPLGAPRLDARDREPRDISHVVRAARAAGDLGEPRERRGGAAADERADDGVLPRLGRHAVRRARVDQLEQRRLGVAQVAVGDLPDHRPERALAAVTPAQPLDERAGRLAGGRVAAAVVLVVVVLVVAVLAASAAAVGAVARARATPTGVRGVVAAGDLLGDQLLVDRARLRERHGGRRLGAVAQRGAAAPVPEVDDVLTGGDLDQIDLVDLVGRPFAERQERLLDHPHVSEPTPRRGSSAPPGGPIERADRRIRGRRPARTTRAAGSGGRAGVAVA